MVNSVLVVCTGNVCRSPVGERLLRQACPRLTVDSAGTMAMSGHCADPSAHAVATSNGLCLDGHVARQLTPDMVRSYDLLLVMELEHIKQVMALAPWARGKTLLFGLWNGSAVIPDPWRQSQTVLNDVFKQLERASQQWAARLGK